MIYTISTKVHWRLQLPSHQSWRGHNRRTGRRTSTRSRLRARGRRIGPAIRRGAVLILPGPSWQAYQSPQRSAVYGQGLAPSLHRTRSYRMTAGVHEVRRSGRTSPRRLGLRRGGGWAGGRLRPSSTRVHKRRKATSSLHKRREQPSSEARAARRARSRDTKSMSASRAHANGRPAQAVARQLSASRQDLGKYSAAAARGQTAEAPPDPHPEQGRGAVHRPKVECDHTPPPPSAATPAADAAGPSSITTTESLPAGGCTAPCAPPATSRSCSEAPVARHGDALAAAGAKVKLRYASCVCAGTQSTRVCARAQSTPMPSWWSGSGATDPSARATGAT